MANIITGIRIVCSIALLFFPVFSPMFYALYIAAGISDMVDGTIARKTGTVSEFGSKLDTAADFVLVVVCLIKLIPVLHIPTWLFIWITIVALIKMINIISGYVMYKEFVAVHPAPDSNDNRFEIQRGVCQCGGNVCCDTGRAFH